MKDLKGRRLFVGTPMYGGQCHVDYAFAIAGLSSLCCQLGIALRFHFYCNESLVMRARNATVDAFLQSGDTHLMFIDADIGFDPQDVIRLLAMQDATSGQDAYDVLSAPYPIKTFAWDNIARAAKAGVADADPAQLEKYAAPILFSPVDEGNPKLDLPLEAHMAGTGFMMIRRATFEAYRAAFPERDYVNDPHLVADGQSARIFAYFDTEIDSKTNNLAAELRHFLEARPDATHEEITGFLGDPDASMADYSNRFVSEDVMFCRRIRAAGMKIWLCPWMRLTHTGNYTFSAALPYATPR